MRHHCSEFCLEGLFSSPSRIRGSGIRIARGGSSNFFSVCLFKCFTFLSCWEAGEFGVSGIYRKGPIKPTPPTDGGEMGRKDDPPSHIQQSHPRRNFGARRKEKKTINSCFRNGPPFPLCKAIENIEREKSPQGSEQEPLFFA